MAYPLKRPIQASKLANELGLDFVGTKQEFWSVGNLSDARAGTLVFSRKNIEEVAEGCVYIADHSEIENFGGNVSVLQSISPRIDFMRALKWLSDQNLFLIELNPPKIHPSTQIGQNVFVDSNCDIEENCIIEPNVVILRGTKIGKNSRIRANSTIGSDGFGFERLSDGSILRFIHLGGVQIGENVEIGANSCVARGALGDTLIEDNVKIDNLVHIAHNVRIAKGAIIIAGAEISGSCFLGENSWVGPNACVIEKVSIGAGSFVGIGSTVIRSIPAGEVHVGNPAKYLRETK